MIGSLHTEQRGANFLKEEREFWLDTELKTDKEVKTREKKRCKPRARTFGLPPRVSLSKSPSFPGSPSLAKIGDLYSMTVEVLLDHKYCDIWGSGRWVCELRLHATLSGPMQFTQATQCVAWHSPVERLQIQILGWIKQREEWRSWQPLLVSDFCF